MDQRVLITLAEVVEGVMTTSGHLEWHPLPQKTYAPRRDLHNLYGYGSMVNLAKPKGAVEYWEN